MPVVVVAVIVTVALVRGGYAASGMLVLELGAAVLLLWVGLEVLFGTTEEQRMQHRAQPRLRDKEIELVPPGLPASAPRRSREHYVLVSGFPFKRTGLGWPLVLMTLWISLSLVPLPESLLARLSPRAQALRAEAASLHAPPATTGKIPVSLAPFMTTRGLWLWGACLALIFVGAHMAARPERARRFSELVFAAGVAFGLYGLGQWLFGLRDLLGQEALAVQLRASGSFGNRNHYAAFMEMLLLCGLGWVGMRHAGSDVEGSRRGGSLLYRMEAGGGKLFVLGLGVVVASLGLLFSLSRAGITCGLLGCVLYLTLRPTSRSEEDVVDLSWMRRISHMRAMTGVAALALAVLGAAIWIGLDPLAQRFRILPGEWESERHRLSVWSDAIEAIPDFAVTGSGLGTFRYVFPLYRSFGGRTSYSWAHNDYLQAAIELGMPGVVLLTWGMIAAGRRARRLRSSLRRDPALLHLHSGYLAALAAIALHSFTDFGLHLAANAALFSVILGMSMGLEPGSGRGGGAPATGSGSLRSRRWLSPR